jgi:hypothetical protein
MPSPSRPFEFKLSMFSPAAQESHKKPALPTPDPRSAVDRSSPFLCPLFLAASDPLLSIAAPRPFRIYRRVTGESEDLAFSPIVNLSAITSAKNCKSSQKYRLFCGGNTWTETKTSILNKLFVSSNFTARPSEFRALSPPTAPFNFRSSSSLTSLSFVLMAWQVTRDWTGTGRIIGFVVMGVPHWLTPDGRPVEPEFNPRAQRRRSGFAWGPAAPAPLPSTIGAWGGPPNTPPFGQTLFGASSEEDIWPEFEDEDEDFANGP